MLVPLPWLCSECSSAAEDDNSAACGGGYRDGIAGATPGSSPLSSSNSVSAFDDAISIPSLLRLLPLHLLHHQQLLCRHRRTHASATSFLLYSATESTLSVYDLSDLRPIESLPAPSGAGAAKSISISPDGSALFTAHQDGRIRVWNRSSRSGLHRLVTSLPTTADRLRRLPLPKNYVTIRRHHKRLWIEHADAVSGIAADASGLLYSVSWDKTLKVWSVSGLRCLESVSAHEDAVNAIVVAADGTVYTGSADRRIRVWTRPAGAKQHELIATLDRHRSAVNALALSGDGSVLYSGACDRSVLVWERNEKADYMTVTGTLRGHERAILSLACAGEIVVSGSGDGVVRVWRRDGIRRAYSCLAVMGGHTKGVRSLVAVMMPGSGRDGGGSGDDEEYRVCSGSLDGEIRVWRVRVSSL
ncbi:protein JINGUBANG-like [Dendrobium catenatum]|uniref:protein JINGUBANG-like n=1 Tax=Dendrobium catenatum TaxID=906689 RepID=UPI0010A08726|nr:protein JINGUBANG-like [Dendrobium catenatum]